MKFQNLQQLANQYCNVGILWFLRVMNVMIFLAITFYIGSWITGYDLLKIIYGISIVWGIIRGFNIDFIYVITRKILSLEWGLSLLIFSVFAMFLFHFNGYILKHIKR